MRRPAAPPKLGIRAGRCPEARGLAGERARPPSGQSSPEGVAPNALGPRRKGRPRLLRETLAAATPADRLPPRGCRAPRPDPGLRARLAAAARGRPGSRRAPHSPPSDSADRPRLAAPPADLPRLQPAPPARPEALPCLRREVLLSSPSPAAQGSRLAQGPGPDPLGPPQPGPLCVAEKMEGSGGGPGMRPIPGKSRRPRGSAHSPRQPGLWADLWVPGPELQERDRKTEGSPGP